MKLPVLFLLLAVSALCSLLAPTHSLASGFALSDWTDQPAVQASLDAAPELLQASAGGTVDLARTRATLRAGAVEVDQSVLEQLFITPGTAVRADAAPGQPIQYFRLGLFEDVEIYAYKTAIEEDSIGSTIIKLQVVRPVAGEATLVLRDGHVTGRLRSGARDFLIAPARDGSHTVSEYRPNRLLHKDPLVPDERQLHPIATTLPPAGPSNAVTVNTMIVYTAAANNAITDLLSAASLATSYTNDAFANSDIYIKFNLVGVEPISYQEQNGETGEQIVSDLSGNFEVQALRDAQKADLVSGWAMFTDACGVGYLLDDADQYDDSTYGYNDVSLSFGNDCLTDAYAHEHGHNLGSHHDRYQDDPNDQDTTHYNYAYVDTVHQFLTIMSYNTGCSEQNENCALIPYYSNPNLQWSGYVIGIPDSAPNSADSTRRMNEIAPYVAQFRSQAATKSPLLSSVLPSSRSVTVNENATFFMSLINGGTVDVTNCTIPTMFPVIGGYGFYLDWQQTDPATNAPTGTQDAPFNLAAGQSASFLLTAEVGATASAASAYFMDLGCDNNDGPGVVTGVNTLEFAVNATPSPDIIALAVTPSGNGILAVPVGGSAAFSVASINVGASGQVSFAADTGTQTLPLSLAVCQTDTATGQCLAPPAASVSVQATANGTPTFAVFASASGAIALNPADSRIFIHFIDAGGNLYGSASVAVQAS
jgi:hypothetical protein